MNVIRHNLMLASLRAVLRFPRTETQTTFHDERAALAGLLHHPIALPSKDNHIHEACIFFPVISAAISPIDCETERNHGIAGGQEPLFRIACHVATKINGIHLGHNDIPTI